MIDIPTLPASFPILVMLLPAALLLFSWLVLLTASLRLGVIVIATVLTMLAVKWALT